VLLIYQSGGSDFNLYNKLFVGPAQAERLAQIDKQKLTYVSHPIRFKSNQQGSRQSTLDCPEKVKFETKRRKQLRIHKIPLPLKFGLATV
jgi:hypothetical protein